MNKLPTLFLSHGSPMIAIQDSPARRFLQGLGKTIAKPKAIIVVSAHWETLGQPVVGLSSLPETIHDFGGFPDALYAIRYPVRGAPVAAAQAAGLLEFAGFSVRRDENRGLDHGAWVPLMLMYPDADIPVAQISMLHGATPAQHLKLGQALASLREEGVLIVGSGLLTHNLRELHWDDINAAPPPWVSDFSDWMLTNLRANQLESLLEYRRLAPSAVRNHPTEEHLLPLFVALGAAGNAPAVERLHASYEYGVAAMEMYAFS